MRKIKHGLLQIVVPTNIKKTTLNIILRRNIALKESILTNFKWLMASLNITHPISVVKRWP